MSKVLKLRPMGYGDEVEVCNLVARTFNEFIAPEFSEEGVDEFFKYSNPRALKRRLESGYFAIVSEVDGKLAGMIELKANNHISMLYVDKTFHRRGIAKELIKEVMPLLSKSSDITVNSSRYAVPFYEKLGFIQFEDERTIYGVIHVPMMVKTSKLNEILDENTSK